MPVGCDVEVFQQTFSQHLLNMNGLFYSYSYLGTKHPNVVAPHQILKSKSNWFTLNELLATMFPKIFTHGFINTVEFIQWGVLQKLFT